MRPLTKTSYLMGRQCALRLWRFTRGIPERAADADDAAEDFVAEGARVERLAYALFSGGASVIPPVDDGDEEDHETRPTFGEALRATSDLLARDEVTAIFQAHLAVGGAVAIVDVLQRVEGGWHVVEVKASTSVKPIQRHDLAYQCVLAERAGLRVVGAAVVHLDKGFEHDGGPLDVARLLTRTDCTDDVRALLGETRLRMDALRAASVAQEAPVVVPTNRCKSSAGNAEGDRPSTCGHLAADGECGRALPEHWAWRLPNLRGKAKTCVVEALESADLRDLEPDDAVGWTKQQRRVIEAARTGRPVVDAAALRAWIDALEYPLAYLDFEFETGHAIPRYAGLRPYDKVPFQWSMHVQRAPGAQLEAPRPFLHTDASDPRRPFMASLLAALPATGSVVAHSIGAESSVLRTCGRSLDGEFEVASAAVITRLVDTMELAQNGYCHPGQGGSWSIKKLAPALLGRGYDDLHVQDGMAAVRAWRALVAGEDPDPAGTARRLREYCGRDTQLMHDVVEALRTLAGAADR